MSTSSVGALMLANASALPMPLKVLTRRSLKDVLTQVATVHGPAKTEGSEIRDNVAKLNNQFEDYARRALPALDVMRMALVKVTGGSEDSLRRDYERGCASIRSSKPAANTAGVSMPTSRK